MYSHSWATGQKDSYSDPFAQALVSPGGQQTSGWSTRWENNISSSLTSGATETTYNLAVDLELTAKVNDGFGNYPTNGTKVPAPWLKVDTCHFTVRNSGYTP